MANLVVLKKAEMLINEYYDDCSSTHVLEQAIELLLAVLANTHNDQIDKARQHVADFYKEFCSYDLEIAANILLDEAAKI